MSDPGRINSSGLTLDPKMAAEQLGGGGGRNRAFDMDDLGFNLLAGAKATPAVKLSYTGSNGGDNQDQSLGYGYNQSNDQQQGGYSRSQPVQQSNSYNTQPSTGATSAYPQHRARRQRDVEPFIPPSSGYTPASQQAPEPHSGYIQGYSGGNEYSEPAPATQPSQPSGYNQSQPGVGSWAAQYGNASYPGQPPQSGPSPYTQQPSSLPTHQRRSGQQAFTPSEGPLYREEAAVRPSNQYGYHGGNTDRSQTHAPQNQYPQNGYQQPSTMPNSYQSGGGRGDVTQTVTSSAAPAAAAGTSSRSTYRKKNQPQAQQTRAAPVAAEPMRSQPPVFSSRAANTTSPPQSQFLQSCQAGSVSQSSAGM